MGRQQESHHDFLTHTHTHTHTHLHIFADCIDFQKEEEDSKEEY